LLANSSSIERSLALHSGTDLRIGQVGHGLEPHAFGDPAQLLPMTTIINLKTAKLRRGITSQFTLKRAKMQASRFLSVR